MTKKIIKWWMKFSFWNRVRLIFTAVGLGSQAGMFMLEIGSNFTKWVVLGATILAIIITHGAEDRNNNDVADVFEDGKE